MNTIPAQEIKQRGITAVDELLERGPVHVISRNRPKYVIMDEQTYEELIAAKHHAFLAEVKQSLAEIKTGKGRKFHSAASLLAAIDDADEPE